MIVCNNNRYSNQNKGYFLQIKNIRFFSAKEMWLLKLTNFVFKINCNKNINNSNSGCCHLYLLKIHMNLLLTNRREYFGNLIEK